MTLPGRGNRQLITELSLTRSNIRKRPWQETLFDDNPGLPCDSAACRFRMHLNTAGVQTPMFRKLQHRCLLKNHLEAELTLINYNYFQITGEL